MKNTNSSWHVEALYLRLGIIIVDVLGVYRNLRVDPRIYQYMGLRSG